jgi:predicted HicB family RNase H-like nuclease
MKTVFAVISFPPVLRRYLHPFDLTGAVQMFRIYKEGDMAFDLPKAVFYGLALIAACLMVSSCGGPRSESPRWHSRTSFENKVQYFEVQCMKLGVPANSSEMRGCISQRMDASQNRAATVKAAEDNAILNSILSRPIPSPTWIR